MGLFVCGSNCLSSLEYFSPSKIACVTKPWKAGEGGWRGGMSKGVNRPTHLTHPSTQPTYPSIPSTYPIHPSIYSVFQPTLLTYFPQLINLHPFYPFSPNPFHPPTHPFEPIHPSFHPPSTYPSIPPTHPSISPRKHQHRDTDWRQRSLFGEVHFYTTLCGDC